jgi:hypothetical protein
MTTLPYVRIETILLEAFPTCRITPPPGPAQGYSADRIYELRSYEGPTEQYFANKVQMFNQGGEITLFDKLGFHAVFYASVLSGAHMPNLMYMTSFDNMAARDEHWKNFRRDPTWKQLVILAAIPAQRFPYRRYFPACSALFGVVSVPPGSDTIYRASFVYRHRFASVYRKNIRHYEERRHRHSSALLSLR